MPTRFLGSDFQINILDIADGIAGNQQLPQVTTLSDGRFAVVYQDDFNGGIADNDPIAAIFNADGTTSSGFVRVNGFVGLETQPHDAALPGGGFGVVWTDSLHAAGTADAAPTNINYQRVNADGSISTPELPIGDFGLSVENPAIATLSTGRQVVAFESTFSATDHDVWLNVVSADGLTTQFFASSAFAIDTSAPFWEANPDVAALPIGNTAMIVYEDGFGTTTASANISARIFDGATNTKGARITIADHAGELFNPKIAALDSHRYVIIYDDSDSDLFGKIYDTTTNTLSPEFEIDQPGGVDEFPAVAATADGGFIVTWTTEGATTGFDAEARRFNSDGVAMGQQFLVNRLNDNSTQGLSSVSVSGANAFFGWTDFVSRSGDATPDSVRGQMMSLTTPPDFNDDGLSDMLWRNSDGTLALWDINSSGAIKSSGAPMFHDAPVRPDASWSVAAESDFSGDGRTDLVWRNTAGSTVLWTMNGVSVTSSLQFTSAGNPVNPDPSWSVAGAGDFDGDGMSDLLWRNSAGQLVLWTLNGSTITGGGFVTSGGSPLNPDPSWNVAGVGDVDGDGKSDLIWRNSATNEVTVWFMNGGTVTGSSDLNAGGVSVRPDASWSLAGVGDFNADGSADLLWRRSDGTLTMWLMNGANIAGSNFVNSGGFAVSPDASWHIVEIGDFNGDAQSDILWRSDSGVTAEWLMKGTTILSSVTPSLGGAAVNPDPTWSMQAKPTIFG
jgi:VCBS repeat protein